jgi:hypothetical protein
MRLLFFCFLICTATFFSYSQSPDPLYGQDTFLQWRDSYSLYFEFSNRNYFKNNEYSNDIINGYTLIGYKATPKISYYLSDQTKISGGAFFSKNFGEPGFHDIKPVFTIQQKLSPNFSLLTGTIYNSNRHNLIRPLYHPEILIKDPTEYGLQFLYHTRDVYLDLWLDWQRFITRNSEFQEEFITGFSAETQLLSENSLTKLFIPLQIIIKHKGGQIGKQDNPISTLVNSAAGLGLNFPLSPGTFQLESYVTGYKKLTDNSQEPFSRGLGFYSKLNYQLNQFRFNFSYWQASRFLTIAGDPLLQSYSLKKDKKVTERKLLEGGLQYSQAFPYTKLSAKFHFIYDLQTSNADYYMGLFVNINLDRILLRP